MNIQALYSAYTCQQRMSIISKPSNHVPTKNGAHLMYGLNLAHSTLRLFKYRLQLACIKAYHNHSPHPTRCNQLCKAIFFLLFFIVSLHAMEGNGCCGKALQQHLGWFGKAFMGCDIGISRWRNALARMFSFPLYAWLEVFTKIGCTLENWNPWSDHF